MDRRDFLQKLGALGAMFGLGTRLTAQEAAAAPKAAAPAEKKAQTPTDVKVTFLGTSHGLETFTRFHSSTMLQFDGRTYIIDAGDGCAGLIGRQKVPLTDLNGIFITHPHEDHYGGLFNLMEQYVFFQHVRRIKRPAGWLPVRVPVTMVEMMREVRRVYYKRPNYNPTLDLQEYHEGEIFNDGHIKVTAYGNGHMPKLKDGRPQAHSFLFELSNGKRIVFSGDLSPQYDLPMAPFEGKRVDLLVSELVHYKPEFAVERLKGRDIGHICFQHHGDWWEAPGWEKRFAPLAAQLPAPAEIMTDGTVHYV